MTSAVPPHFVTAPSLHDDSSNTPHIRSPVKKRLHRPPLAALPSSAISIDLTGQKLPTRDRRAFSFPALQPTGPLIPTTKRKARQSSNVLPPFARKPPSIAIGWLSPFLAPPREHPRALGAIKPAKSTGGPDTPMDVDAVFCSTSDSGVDEGAEPIKAPSVTSAPSKAQRPFSLANHPSSIKSQLAIKQSQSQFSPRKNTQSPVAAQVASAASSRSREDILTWARAVDKGQTQDGASTSEDGRDQEVKRGRSRTRHFETLARIDKPADNNHGDQDEENAGAGTTPKGRIESAFANLTIVGFGVVPIVKAFTSVATSPSPATAGSRPTGLGMQAVPAVTEVSRVAVVANTSAAETDPSVRYYNPGATPTLSTISFSEAMDPSVVTDNPEHIDMVTDDQQSSSSYFALRRVTNSGQNRENRTAPFQLPKLPRPLRPIATTVTALWDISAYLTSFSPFSMPSIVTFRGRQTPAAAAASATPKIDPPTMAPGTAKAEPISAVRAEQPDQSPKQQMVRSIPLDIASSVGGNARTDERIQEREVHEWLNQSASRSASRSRRRRASPSPSPPAAVEDSAPPGHSRKWSYDAEGSDEEDEEQPRGRCRRGKALNCDEPRQTSDKGASTSPGSSASRGRGRKRTVRAL